MLRIIIVCVCVYLIIPIFDLYSQLRENKTQLDALNAESIRLEMEVDELNVLMELGSEREIIEKAARERLNYAYPNEQIFVDISGN